MVDGSGFVGSAVGSRACVFHACRLVPGMRGVWRPEHCQDQDAPWAAGASISGQRQPSLPPLYGSRLADGDSRGWPRRRPPWLVARPTGDRSHNPRLQLRPLRARLQPGRAQATVGPGEGERSSRAAHSSRDPRPLCPCRSLLRRDARARVCRHACQRRRRPRAARLGASRPDQTVSRRATAAPQRRSPRAQRTPQRNRDHDQRRRGRLERKLRPGESRRADRQQAADRRHRRGEATRRGSRRFPASCAVSTVPGS